MDSLSDKFGKPGSLELHTAARLGQLDKVKSLIGRGADINARNSFGETPLALATEYKHTPVALFLLSKGADPNIKTERGNSPLIKASQTNNLEVMKALLESGADPAQRNGAGDTALTLVSRTMDADPRTIKMLEEALARKARAEEREQERLRHEATQQKQEELRRAAQKPVIKFRK